MASVGRGRGIVDRNRARADAGQQQEPGLRNPRSPGNEEWQSTLEMLAMKIAALDVNNDAQLADIKKAMTEYCNSSERMKLLMDDIHERALNDCKFGVRAAVTLSTIAQMTVDNVKLRAVLIQNLQADFNNADSLRAGNKFRYLNAVFFLSEVYNHIRLANNLPIHVLACAHLAYQKSMLSGDESELELCVSMLALNGRKLLTYKPDVLEDLMLAVNGSLISHPDARSRTWLLLAVHLHAVGYEPDGLPPALHALFERHLGAATMMSVDKQLVASPDFLEADPFEDTVVVKHEIKNELKTTKDTTPDVGNVQQRQNAPETFKVESDSALPQRSNDRRAEPRRILGDGNWREKTAGDDGGRGPVFGRLGTRGEGEGNRPTRETTEMYRPARGEGDGNRPARGEGDGNRPARGDGGRRYKDPRDNPETWLPVPARSQADIQAWGLDPSRTAVHWGHDDRHENDRYSHGGGGDVVRAKDWKGKGDGGRYGSGRIARDSSDQPLPDNDLSWD